MGRSVTARLEQLEAQNMQRRAAVEAVKAADRKAAVARLSDEDLEILRDYYAVARERPAWFEEVSQTVRVVSVPLEGGEAARAWLTAFDVVPEGEPDPLPPPEAPAYFEAEAEDWGRALREWEAGQHLPEGVSLEALQTCARWCAVHMRLNGLVARVLLEAVQLSGTIQI